MNSSASAIVKDTLEIAAVAGNFHAIDYLVFGALLMLSVSIGVYFGFFDGTEQTTEEYLLGGRKMKTIPVAISLVARYINQCKCECDISDI